MEKTLCRDLLCTTPHYENAYLHDVVDIVLYLIMPPEDFRCRPLRFLLREVIVRRIILPLLDHFSEADEMNQILIWLLSEISPRPDDFVVCLENSNSLDELEAIFKSVQDEKMILRGKDSGGDQEVIGKKSIVLAYSVLNLSRLVRRIILPLLDHFSEADEMNQILIWLLSEISPRPDDFVVCLENSNSLDELEAIFKSVQDEKMILRGKDSGGDQGERCFCETTAQQFGLCGESHQEETDLIGQ
ncbi:unnamed protein product [Cylicostephanus goldi]|uniref:PXA domain-containing protein n=1 Tax=Cylicostephanus goldi TaxID=71465 RepID=A0A3P7MXL0_CYLGO|nr:unnamed protein product [Cylicostephanus goldi]